MSDTNELRAVKLTELLERCEKASGGDRYIDAMLELELVTPELGALPWIQRSLGKWVEASCEDNVVYAPPYTRSADAAAALVQRILPGWGYGYEVDSIAFGKVWKGGCHDDTVVRSEAYSPPLAILAALLRALSTSDARAPSVEEGKHG